MPHSVLSQPRQRPERGSSPGWTFDVQGEQPIEGVDAETLVAGLKTRGHRAAQTVSGPDELADILAENPGDGDMVVCLGAGDITKWAAGLADAVSARRGG